MWIKKKHRKCLRGLWTSEIPIKIVKMWKLNRIKKINFSSQAIRNIPQMLKE